MSIFTNNRSAFADQTTFKLKLKRLYFSIFHLGIARLFTKLIPSYLNIPKYLALFIQPFFSITLKRFYGSSSLEGCIKIINNLDKHNIKASIDYCVENQSSNYDVILKSIQKSIKYANKNNIPFVVIKLTAFASVEFFEKLQKLSKNQIINLNDLIYNSLYNNSDNDHFAKDTKTTNKTDELSKKLYFIIKDLDELCQQAKTFHIKLLFDAEQSWIQDVIDKICENLMLKHHSLQNTFIYHTIQMYKIHRFSYLANLTNSFNRQNKTLGIKLVRGAYLEAERNYANTHNIPCQIHKSKHNTDDSFDQAMLYCLENAHITKLYLATHNEKSLTLMTKTIEKNHKKFKKLANHSNDLWCAQLLGMGDHISYHLADNNFNTTKYIPYGPLVSMIPYLLRRVNENSSIDGHGKREYEVLLNELNLRKIQKNLKNPQNH